MLALQNERKIQQYLLKYLIKLILIFFGSKDIRIVNQSGSLVLKMMSEQNLKNVYKTIKTSYQTMNLK